MTTTKTKHTPGVCGKVHEGTYTVDVMRVCSCEKPLLDAASDMFELVEMVLLSAANYRETLDDCDLRSLFADLDDKARAIKRKVE